MPDPIFNAANDKSIPLGGDLWIVTVNGDVAAVFNSADDCARSVTRALSITSQPGQATGVMIIYYVKKSDLAPLPIVTVGARFTPAA